MDDKPLRSKTPDEPNHWPIQLLRGRLSSRTKKSGSNKQANRKKNKQADRILTPFDLQALRSTRRSRSASTPTNHIGSIHHPLPAPASQTRANRTGRASGSAPPDLAAAGAMDRAGGFHPLEARAGAADRSRGMDRSHDTRTSHHPRKRNWRPCAKARRRRGGGRRVIAYPEGRERRREARRLGEGSRGGEEHGKGKGFGRALFISRSRPRCASEDSLNPRGRGRGDIGHSISTVARYIRLADAF